MDTKIKKQAAPAMELTEAESGTKVNHVQQSDYTPNNSKYKVYEVLLERPIAFHRIFKIIAGNSSAAIFLSQAYYWSKNKSAINRGGWFIKSGKEWEEETGLTRFEQETARRICKELGVIDERLRRWNSHATLHFRLNKNRLFELIEQSPSLRKTSKLIDCGKPANYSLRKTRKLYTETTQRLPSKNAGEGFFKTWSDTPKESHPYFEACINSPVSLPKPTPKEIKAWLETFDEWTAKGFSVKQIKAAGKYAHDHGKIVSSPKSLTWILNSDHARANVRKDTQSAEAETETELARIRKRQKRT